MNRETIITELENFKEQIEAYEKALVEFEQAQKLFEDAQSYKARRVIEFDEKNFPEYIESKIGKKNPPKEFANFDPRRLLKKSVTNRNSEIVNYNKKISELKRDFDLRYEENRKLLQKEDDREEAEKIQLAKKEMLLSKEVVEMELKRIESINLLPKSLVSSVVIDKIIKYFSDWRVDSMKEAINLYFDETWRQEFSNTIEERLKENNQLITRVSEDTIEMIENLSELKYSVDDLSLKINSLESN